ncbi:unnamed protein product [Coregonus sp. 'balchen']|nr:unnamed protein product [Coregonus sp. 'balchen']
MNSSLFLCLSAPVCPASGGTEDMSTTAGEQGAKRKREAPDDEEVVVVDEQKLEENKVCKGVPTLKGSRLAYFAVFDGHGGARASHFTAEHLHHTLALKFPKVETENLDKLEACLDGWLYSHLGGRVLGVLEVSKSIGDGQYKRIGVISTPDLRRCQLTPNDRFIILGCDGLFKVFSAEEAVKYVLNVLQNGSVERKEGQTEEEGRYEAACQRLANVVPTTLPSYWCLLASEQQTPDLARH